MQVNDVRWADNGTLLLAARGNGSVEVILDHPAHGIMIAIPVLAARDRYQCLAINNTVRLQGALVHHFSLSLLAQPATDRVASLSSPLGVGNRFADSWSS